MSTEQTRSSFTETSPAPAGHGASPGLLFGLLPLSSAALGGLTVGGFFFIIAAPAFLSDRAGYGTALSIYGTVITLLPVSIVWAALRWTRTRLGPDSADMTWTGIPTSWDGHWVVVTWWTAAIATGWIGIAVLAAGPPDLTPPGGSGFPTLFELLPAGLVALGATLYVAIAATAVLETRTETPILPKPSFFNIDYRCNSGFLKRIIYTMVPYKTVIRLIDVA